MVSIFKITYLLPLLCILYLTVVLKATVAAVTTEAMKGPDMTVDGTMAGDMGIMEIVMEVIDMIHIIIGMTG